MIKYYLTQESGTPALLLINVILVMLILVGCTTYYHRFDLDEDNIGKVGKYDIYASAIPSGHGENTEKKMKDRKFDIDVSLSFSIAGMDVHARNSERQKLDDFFNVDTIYIKFDDERELRPLPVEEVIKIGSIDIKNDFRDQRFRRIFSGDKFIIPDSVSIIHLIFPFYSIFTDGIKYDTLQLMLERNVKVQHYYFAP